MMCYLILVVYLQSCLRNRSCCRRLWTRPTDSAITCRVRAAAWRTGSSVCWDSPVQTSHTALPSIPSRRFFCTSCPVGNLYFLVIWHKPCGLFSMVIRNYLFAGILLKTQKSVVFKISNVFIITRLKDDKTISTIQGLMTVYP